jgi:hypothetical protein
MASKYGANGWMIILEVFAKPVLMVVGFFVASRVLDPFYDSHHSFFQQFDHGQWGQPHRYRHDCCLRIYVRWILSRDGTSMPLIHPYYSELDITLGRIQWRPI